MKRVKLVVCMVHELPCDSKVAVQQLFDDDDLQIEELPLLQEVQGDQFV